jgi:prepilin-type N-terminal cleavage/methylation domain-containing protein
MSHLPSQSPFHRRPCGFTLIELLVVLSLIVLALAAAVPAFNAITGSRSTDSAENMISAMLVRARATAIQGEQMAGVAFFVNPTDNRATMAIVVHKSSANQLQEDAYPNYRGWSTQSLQTNGTLGPTTYVPGQEASAVVYDNVSKKLIVGAFVNIDANKNGSAASSGTAPPAKPASTSTPWANSYWAGINSGSTEFLDFTSDGTSEFETLPAGVAVQLINDPQGQTQRDRYVQTGVIVFDPQGRLVSVPYAFNNPASNPAGRSAIAQLLKIPAASFPQWPLAVTSPTPAFRSQLGLVIYDRSTFLNQSGNTEGDFSPLVTGIPTLTTPSAFNAEQTEETWIDENTTPLLVNRYNGTLMKGQ